MTDKTIDHRLAWLAGIIDGEGTLGFYIDPARGRRSGRPRGTECWRLEVANTDDAMLVEMMSICDLLGVKALYYALKPRPGCKPQKKVSMRSKVACEIVLTAIYPYLVSKRPRAELMLRAITHRKRTGAAHYRMLGFTSVDRDADFRSMVSEMKSLNRRGIAPEGE